MPQTTAIVLAAGKGTRMKSELPKVLVPVLDRPMIDYVIDALTEVGIRRIIVVIGYRGDLVRSALAARPNVEFVEQTEQLGTGHAVMVCREALSRLAHAEQATEPQAAGRGDAVLIVTGDSPLIQTSSVRRLLDAFQRDRPACILGTAIRDEPGNLGRVVRDREGNFLRIVEVKDADARERAIREVNMSTYIFDSRELLHALGKLTNDNAQREYYITDCPGILRAEGKDVRAADALQPCEALSINNPEELAAVEQVMRETGVRR